MAGHITWPGSVGVSRDGRLGVVKKAVQDDGRTDRRRCHVDSNATVHHGQSFVYPIPIPKLLNSSFAIVERDIPGRVLLIAQLGAVFASVEDEIVQQATTALFHEDTHVSVPRLLGKLEDHILDRSRLS